MQVFNGSFAAIEAVVEQVGSARGIQYHVEGASIEAEQEMRAALARFGAG